MLETRELVRDTHSNEQSSSAPIPRRTLFAWSLGSVAAYYVTASISVLAFPIYNVGLGVNAVMLGWAMSLPRIIDAFFDPFLGWLSDNTRSRWGRRKPYIVAGAFPVGLFTILLWFPPRAAGTDVLFWWFLIVSIFYYLAFSVCFVPGTALGLELSTDYHERTRVQGWQTMLALLAGLLTPWLYKLTLLPVFGGDEVIGVRWVGALIAIIVFSFFLVQGVCCPERAMLAKTEKIRLWDAIRQAFGNGSFRILSSSQFLATAVTFMVMPCLLYVNIYEVCGSKEFAAKVAGWGGMVQLMAAFAQVPFTTKLSHAIGKKNTMMVALGIVAFACVLYIFTLTPKHPYWQVVSNFFYGWGIQGVWMMCSTMLADVCDQDELNTGFRQEGIYSSVSSFIMKAALAVGALGSGYLMSIAGFRADVTPAPEVMANLRHLFIWSQIAGLLICASIIWFYPLTRERMREIRRELDERARAR